jgi:SdrD B-like domain
MLFANFNKVHFNPIIFPTAMKKDYISKILFKGFFAVFCLLFISKAFSSSFERKTFFFSFGEKSKVEKKNLNQLTTASKDATVTDSGQLTIGVSSLISACKVDTVTLTLTNNLSEKGKGYTGNVKLKIKIPGGSLIEYIPNSVITVPTSLASNTVFTSATSTLSTEIPLPVLGQKTVVKFAYRAGCDINAAAPLAPFEANITYPTGYPLTTETVISTASNVGKGQLTASGMSGFVNTTASFKGEWYDVGRFVNVGYGEIDNVRMKVTIPAFLTDSFISAGVSDNLLSGTQATPDPTIVTPLQPNLTAVSTITNSDNSKTYTYNLSGLALGTDNVMETNESRIVVLKFNDVNECNQGLIKYEYDFNCGGNTTYCQSPAVYSSTRTISTGVPNMTITPTWNAWNGACPSTASWSYKNTGVGNTAPMGYMYNVSIVQRFVNYMDFTNIKMNGVTVPTNLIQEVLPSNFMLTFLIKDNNTNPNLGFFDLDADGFYDDLKINDEVKITYTYAPNLEKACGASLVFTPSSSATFTDLCKIQNGSSSASVPKFGIEQTAPNTQTTTNNFPGLTTGQKATQAVGFSVNYSQTGLNLSGATAQVKVRYSESMELHRDSVYFNGVSLGSPVQVLGTGVGHTATNAGANDKDSVAVYNLNTTQTAALFDNTADNINYRVTYYGCTIRNKTVQPDNFSICVKLASSCPDGSTPKELDLTCKQPWSFSTAVICKVKPCIVERPSIYRITKRGFTSTAETTPIAAIDSSNFYQCDTIATDIATFISGDWSAVEPNGFYSSRGFAQGDAKTTFGITYPSSETMVKNGQTPLTFLPQYSTVAVYRRTPVATTSPDNLKLGTIGALVTEVPILIEDFSPSAAADAASTQNSFGSRVAFISGPANKPSGQATNIFGRFHQAAVDIAPVANAANDVWWVPNGAGTSSIAYNDIVGRTATTLDFSKASSLYNLNWGKALYRAGYTQNIYGDDNYYYVVKLRWKVRDDFPLDNSTSIKFNTKSFHDGNGSSYSTFSTVPGVGVSSTSPGSSNMGSCANPPNQSTTGLAVEKDHFVENPNEVYNANCGLKVSHKVFFESAAGNYFNLNGTTPSGEVRVPLKITKVVANLTGIPYQLTGTTQLKYVSCNGGTSPTTNTVTNITASATTGNITFTGALAGGEFPRADDCSGNTTAYDLSYSLQAIGTPVGQFKAPIEIYTKDEFGVVKILRDTITIQASKPQLQIIGLTPVLINDDGGTCQPATYDVIVKNISNNTDAPNVYIAAEIGTGVTAINNIINRPGSMAVVDSVKTYGSTNKFAYIGRIAAGDSVVVRVLANTNVCAGNLKMIADYNCDYPATVGPVAASTTKVQTTLSFDANAPQILSRPVLAAGVDGINITDLCSDPQVTLEVKNADLPNINKMLATIQLPASVNYLPASLEVVHTSTLINSGTYTAVPDAGVVTVSGTSLTINLNTINPFSTACGLTGVDTLTRNDFRIRFKVRFKGCPKALTETISYKFEGENYCGLKAKTEGIVNIIYLGLSGNTNTYSISALKKPLQICAVKNSSQTISDVLWIKNNGGGGAPGPSVTTDSATINVPYNKAQLTLNNFTLGSPFSAVPVTINSKGDPEFKLGLPAGIAVGDSIAIPVQYQVTPKIDNYCSAADIPGICYYSTFYSRINLTCTARNLNCSASMPILTKGVDLEVKAFACCFGSIGDYVWLDNIQDGQQGVVASEPPIAGVKVYLLNGITGAKLDSTVTDANGKYLFDSLQTGSYQVKFVAPKGKIITTKNAGNTATDSNIDTAGLSEVISINTTLAETDLGRNNPTIDAGFYSCVVLNAGADLTLCGTANGQYQFAAAPSGQTWVKLSGTGSTINATTGLVSNLSAGIHQFILKYTISNECADTVKITYGITPELSITATPATCPASGGNANDDAKINLVTTTNGIKIDYTSGSTYTGTKTYASLPTGMPVGNVITLPNPSITKNYTVRLYNQGGTCFVDKTLEIKHIVCPLVCPPTTCIQVGSAKN